MNTTSTYTKRYEDGLSAQNIIKEIWKELNQELKSMNLSQENFDILTEQDFTLHNLHLVTEFPLLIFGTTPKERATEKYNIIKKIEQDIEYISSQSAYIPLFTTIYHGKIEHQSIEEYPCQFAMFYYADNTLNIISWTTYLLTDIIFTGWEVQNIGHSKYRDTLLKIITPKWAFPYKNPEIDT